MKRRGFTIFELIVVLAIVIILAAIVYPVLAPKPPHRSNRAFCRSNLKNIALGFKQYIQDSDGNYPLVNVNDAAIDKDHPLGWADSLDIYTKSRQTFWCPAQIQNSVRNNNAKKPSDRDFTDYFFNRNLAGISEEKIKRDFDAVIVLGEGNDGTDAANARYSLSTLPAAWITTEKSPIRRHFDGANYAFVDGHVKWYKVGTIKTLAIR